MQRTDFISHFPSVYSNSHPHPKTGWKDLFRWKWGQVPENPRSIEPEYYRTGDLIPVAPDLRQIEKPPQEGMQLTWIGHSSFLLQLDGQNFLIDPVLRSHCAPLPFPSLKRRVPAALQLANMPKLDGVLISHNHYDHLEKSTIQALGTSVPFHVPAGLERWMKLRGVEQCQRYEWWESRSYRDMRITLTPAQHFSSRGFHDRNRTLWGGWVLEKGNMRIYYAGDTGYCPHFRRIRERMGPMDLSILPIGAYQPRWFMKPVHVDASEAVQIHLDVQSRLSVACHWGTFRLTDEAWNEPPALLRQSLSQRGIPEEKFRVLRIGETLRV